MEGPVLVSLLAGEKVLASSTLVWHNEVERGVLVMALAVCSLDLDADTVVATYCGGSGEPVAGDVAIVTGRGVVGPGPLAELLLPLRDLLPPNEGFRPLAAEVDAARRNLAGGGTKSSPA